MGAILKLSIKEIRKKKWFSILMFFVCVVSMNMTVTSITNATSAAYQQKVFQNNIGIEMDHVLHLKYHYTKENNEFANVLSQYRDFMEGLPGVKVVGQFDATGMHFTELKDMNSYLEINSKIVSGGKYATHPEITRLLSVDEELLSLVKEGVEEYPKTMSGHLPIYASEVFESILPVGTSLTDERTDEVYEVVGYFANGSQWVDENDLIRFPLNSLDGWFIAPFSMDSENDILTQLSMLHNTYILITDDADIECLKQEIHDYSIQNGFEATANTLAEEYAIYNSETEVFIKKQVGLALFISAMGISSIIAVFTTNALLKRKQYGIMVANGFTLKDVVVGIAMEIAIFIISSILITWSAKLVELKTSTDLFKDVLLTAHICFALPVCLGLGTLLIIIATIIPAIEILKHQPSELIGGDANGNY